MEKSVSFWFAFNNAILPQAPVSFYALFANWSPQLFSLSQYWRKAHEWPVCTALLMLHWFQSQFDYLHIQLLCYCILKRLHCLWAPLNPDVIEALFPYRLSKFSQVKWLLRLQSDPSFVVHSHSFDLNPIWGFNLTSQWQEVLTSIWPIILYHLIPDQFI